MMGDAPTKNWGPSSSSRWPRHRLLQLCLVPGAALHRHLPLRAPAVGPDGTTTRSRLAMTPHGASPGASPRARVWATAWTATLRQGLPHGIDIRQGLQLECVGCAACIDACDDVMQKLGRRPGLVRYDSLAGFAGRAKRWCARGPSSMESSWRSAPRSPPGTSRIRPAILGVTRMVGAPYYVDGGSVRNQFLVRIVNKRSEPAESAEDARPPRASRRANRGALQDCAPGRGDPPPNRPGAPEPLHGAFLVPSRGQ